MSETPTRQRSTDVIIYATTPQTPIPKRSTDPRKRPPANEVRTQLIASAANSTNFQHITPREVTILQRERD